MLRADLRIGLGTSPSVAPDHTTPVPRTINPSGSDFPAGYASSDFPFWEWPDWSGCGAALSTPTAAPRSAAPRAATSAPCSWKATPLHGQTFGPLGTITPLVDLWLEERRLPGCISRVRSDAVGQDEARHGWRRPESAPRTACGSVSIGLKSGPLAPWLVTLEAAWSGGCRNGADSGAGCAPKASAAACGSWASGPPA